MTMKKLALLPLLFAATVSITAHAEEIRYVSDDLSTYVHSGPSNRYRIAGSLNSGEKVTVLDVNNESGFVWLPKELLSTTPSLKERVPAMEEEIKTLRGKLANIDGTWNDKTADMQNRVAASDDIINNLKKENDSLRNQVVVAKKKLDAISVQLDDKQRDIILQWFMYGGGVAGAGLLLGLLLPHMIPRRKKKDRWMN